MKRLQPLLFSAGLLFLAACSQDAQPTAAAPGFNFSVDPGAESVTLTSSGAAALKALQVEECGSEEPRVLFAEDELALETFDFAFLPGNILEITASFTNVTDSTYEQPFTFSQADSTNNIVSSDEPEVTDADLGGDGQLGPDETTSVLTFTVEHMGQPFDYEVLAEAVVVCGDDSGEPGEPIEPGPGDDEVDLEVVKTGEATVETDADGNATLNYTITVTNNGTADATGVELTDSISIDLGDLVGVDATATASLPLPDGCVLDATVLDADVVVCTIGDLTAGASTEIDLSFDLDVTGDLGAEDSITVTNTAAVGSDADDANPDDNLFDFDTVVTAPVVTTPLGADLTVTKTGDTAVTTDADGNATLDYTVVVTNNGDAIAEGVELTDTFVIDLSAFGDTATVTAALPPECALSSEATAPGTVITICTLGALAADGGSTTLDLSFTVDLPADAAAGELPVTNTATATTTSGDADDTDNTDLVNATVTVPSLP